jgi:hypothetical protein
MSINTPNLPKDNSFFQELQNSFLKHYESLFPDPLAPKTVVIVPSLTMDQEILAKINGISYYEERLLCMLMLLRMPRTKVIYVTSLPIDPIIVDYYLHLLPGITNSHASERLTLLSCFDSSPRSLTEKVLERPRLIEKIKKSIPKDHFTHLSFFNITSLEKELALKLEIPFYGCDPDLSYLGDKTNSRKLFRDCGLLLPPGYEDLHTVSEMTQSLFSLKLQYPGLRKAVVKLNEGFSGDGNAIFSYDDLSLNFNLAQEIQEQLANRLSFVASDLNLRQFFEKWQAMGGVVEVFVEGEVKESPSVQCRINPSGNNEVISTHDQVLGGDDGQVFLGAHFPAHQDYAIEIGRLGKILSDSLQKKGVIGRFGVDFLSVREGKDWKHYAIEVNLRKGGTTHPFLMLQFLTNGKYDYEKGEYLTPNHQKRYYFCSDNLQDETFKGLTPPDLIDIAICNNLFYDASIGQGATFHLMGALSQYGKLGLVCIAKSREEAQNYYQKTLDVLKEEGKKNVSKN